MKPIDHAKSSVQQFGGKPEDYLDIHNWFDQTKSHLADQRHRAILHNSFGIFLCEQVFGTTIKNSDGKEVSVRDIGEQHVLEDFRGKFVPTIQDWLENMFHQPWMNNGQEYLPRQLKRAKWEPETATGPVGEILHPIEPLQIDDQLIDNGDKPSGLEVPELQPGEDIVYDGSGPFIRDGNFAGNLPEDFKKGFAERKPVEILPEMKDTLSD